jgi:hypothetical protein
MIPVQKGLPLLLILAAGPVWAAGDYIGVLRPAPNTIAIPESGFYLPLAGPFGAGLQAGVAPAGSQFKLGYRYSSYLAVESGYADSVGLGSPLPGTGGGFRARGLSVATVGTLPLWSRGALYGHFGAYRTEGSPALLGPADWAGRPGAGLRYGLGLKVDLSRHIGMQAEMERVSPLDRWGPREAEADQVSVGVTLRF